MRFNDIVDGLATFFDGAIKRAATRSLVNNISTPRSDCALGSEALWMALRLLRLLRDINLVCICSMGYCRYIQDQTQY